MDDLEFVNHPTIYVAEGASIPDGLLPHLGSDREFCYLERGSEVLDRYNPGGMILYCLKRAEEALEKAIGGKFDIDVAAEFAAYWSIERILTNVDNKNIGNSAVIVSVDVEAGSKKSMQMYLVDKDGLPGALTKRQTKLKPEMCHILQTAKVVTAVVGDANWPPENLGSLLTWLKDYIPGIESEWQRICRSGDGYFWWIALKASNGMFLARIESPKSMQTPEFLKSRRGQLPLFMARNADKAPVRRYTGYPVDAEYVFGRNLHGMQNLSDKKIFLIGCGTIGGYLAQFLAVSGAGIGSKGELTLVDHDQFSSSNLGRHILGIEDVEKFKAIALADHLRRTVPYVKIRPITENALKLLDSLSNYDLVIDATGAEAFSISLNEHAVKNRPKFPPVLHVWITAGGGAAAALFCDSREQACFKCLRPDLNSPPRYRIARNNDEFVRNRSCGDSPYIPFPVSSSTQAASMALEICLGWANRKIGHRFRVRTFDEARAFLVEDRNVKPAENCPACRS